MKRVIKRTTNIWMIFFLINVEYVIVIQSDNQNPLRSKEGESEWIVEGLKPNNISTKWRHSGVRGSFTRKIRRNGILWENRPF